MNLTVEALKELYIALGGNATKFVDTMLIPDMIKEIAAYISAGGAAELPSVTTADNGKVLTVVEGEWSAAALPTT